MKMHLCRTFAAQKHFSVASVILLHKQSYTNAVQAQLFRLGAI